MFAIKILFKKIGIFKGHFIKDAVVAIMHLHERFVLPEGTNLALALLRVFSI